MADWKKNPIIAIVAIAVLVLAVVLVVLRPMAPKMTYLIKCESCSKEFQAKLAKDILFPVACPSCGKRTVYRLIKWRCNACGNTFSKIDKPLTPGAGSGDMTALREATAMRCPNCGVAGKLEKME